MKIKEQNKYWALEVFLQETFDLPNEWMMISIHFTKEDARKQMVDFKRTEYTNKKFRIRKFIPEK